MPDLATIPGIADLWELTLGEPSVRVAVIDGPVDLTHPCFAGADLEVLTPWWLPDELMDEVKPPEMDSNDERLEHIGDERGAELRREHGTWVSSILFGSHASAVAGLAPRCKGQIVPALRGDLPELDPVNLAHAIDLATDAGADLIVAEICLPSLSCDVDEIVKRSLRNAASAGVLVVAASGNEKGQLSCFPAASPDVLAIGAYDDEGRMYRFSNWGPEYEGHGLAAPGGNIEGAIPGGGTKIHKGTSCSAPVVAGVAALLVSLQVARGAPPDPVGVGRALVRTAAPCSDEVSYGEPRRCIAGRLDVPAATRYVLDELRAARFADRHAERRGGSPGNVVLSSVERVAPRFVGTLVFALGTIGYDFETEVRRDTFTRYMAEEGPGADVRDERRVLSHLVGHPADTAALTWVLHVGGAPAYAIEPVGPYAADIHARLVRLLAAQLAVDEARAERVSLPGRLTSRRLELESGERVAVVEVDKLRGLHGLNVETLAAAAARSVATVADEAALRAALADFLTKVHVELVNLGCTSPQRAMDFAATNAYQAAESFAAALADGMILEAIYTQRSGVCRLDSDCWDVCLRFFDPEHGRRARKLFRFTIDVSDVMPVTLGEVKSWAERKPKVAA